jgi:hypothetical protein
MRWKEIKEDGSGAQAPTGWAEALDRGIVDADERRVSSVRDVIGDLDATLSEMASDPSHQGGHGNDIPNRTTTNKRRQS